MLGRLLKTIIGSKNERELKKLQPLVEEVNSLEGKVRELRDAQLQRKTFEFKERIERGETLDDILPEAFAVVREVAKRVLDMRHFDCQILGGVVLHQGRIAEMATGEGKTLVATLAAYLNALEGKGVHIITVNDYLSKRDRDWMGGIYEFLGLKVDVIYHDMDQRAKKEAYQADITYGTNTEFGFDCLRDNMAVRWEDRVQRGYHFAIVDEVDSILIDEARTPLIISGHVEDSSHRYNEIKGLVERMAHSQSALISKLLSETERLLEEGKEYEAGIKLLQVKRGTPKNRRFLKLIKDGKYKKLIEKVERDFIRDRKLHELDEELYFSIEEKSNIVDLSEKGRWFLSPKDPNLFVLPDLSEIDSDGLGEREKEKRRKVLEKEFYEKSEKIQNITQLLKAYSLFEKDVDYVVTDGKVLIVDEFTGRLLPGRRYSDGLHQALEAKEGVKIEGETQTLATITIQNYFRLYQKLSGMTGTAETEAPEFWKIYKLDVVVIPTNEPVRRINYADVIYKTKAEKYKAVIKEIETLHKQGRPVLVGTTSVEVSEILSRMLGKRIKHSVLNAKRHKEEAEIVAKAGLTGEVTIATNMAGRGTDIKLGAGVVKCEFCCIKCEIEKEKGCAFCKGPKKGKKMTECLSNVPCGLHIIGTERHEARRIDRQLRGRTGRQGDPGSSRFYLSLEDDLLRIFGSEKISAIMDRLGMEEDQPIEHKLITRAIENAQGKVEAHNFDIRKHLLEYDDVMNKQREIIYTKREKVLSSEDLSQEIQEIIEELLTDLVDTYAPEKGEPEDWDQKGLEKAVQKQFFLPLRLDIERDSPKDLIPWKLKEMYQRKEIEFGAPYLKELERVIYLQVIDNLWKEHLLCMDHLKEGIGLRGYGQRDPLREYQKEGYELFLELMEQIKRQYIEILFRIEPAMEIKTFQTPSPLAQSLILSHGQEESRPKPTKREGRKIGRNEPCICGSGKKYKRCCGR